MHELADGVARGQIALTPDHGAVNMHCHTFFSFNAYGHSPTSLAWMAKKNGYAAAGIVDFDVLDGVDEFLDACELLGVRGSAGIETRVYIPEFASREINSPGEPGICYHMGIGFASGRAPATVAPVLASMRERAERRNREMCARINAHLSPLGVDYEDHVLRLTPSGNATERHMLAAYLREAEARYPSPETRVRFWSVKLGVPEEALVSVMDDYAKLANLVRGKLMKKGGTGYVEPSPNAFPTVEEFHSLIIACGALPCATWLDGTSEGELAIDELLELLIGKGVVAINIIPDRNWNISDPATRNLKIGKLHEIVRIAGELDLPLNVGTEMNSPGNRLVDDFSAPPMAPLNRAIMAGAYFIYGHTLLQRVLGLGYQSAWAQGHLPSRRARNDFYELVGRRATPGFETIHRLRQFDERIDPSGIAPRRILAALR